MRSDRATIVGTGPIGEEAREILAPFGTIVEAQDNREGSLLPLLEMAIALVVRGDGAASARAIHAAPHLRVIGRSGAGTESVDVPAATELGIPVVYTPGANAVAVAEAAVGYMLALCKRLFHWDAELKAGRWESRNRERGGDLDGATLGIVGFGTIGQALARLCGPFHMRVLVYDPYVAEDVAREHAAERVGLAELLAQADFIVLHTALTDETRGLIDAAALRSVKPGAYLVNLARGAVVESLDVLHDALQDGRLGGVALDVFDPEPPDVSHPLFRHPNCIASPHAMALTRGALRRVFTQMAEDMAAVLRGDRPQFVVNPNVFD